MLHIKTAVISVIGMVLILFALTGFTLFTAVNTHYNCMQLEAMKANLVVSIQTKDELLDKNANYFNRPKEKAAIHAANAKSIKDFRPRGCRGVFG